MILKRGYQKIRQTAVGAIRPLGRAIRTLGRALSKLPSRQNAAYFLMAAFVLCSSVGAFTIYAPAGWITLGVTSGLFGYLLGSD